MTPERMPPSRETRFAERIILVLTLVLMVYAVYIYFGGYL